MLIQCCSLDIDGDEVLLAEHDGALIEVHFGSARDAFVARLSSFSEDVSWHDGHRSPARRQLAEYFAGKRRTFDLVLAPRGTEFQQAVWAALRTIPFGATCSYSDIAQRIGRPSAVRAVGAANGKNPIAIVVPCHRVIGRDGSLTGYAGGLERKRRLLALEGVGRAPGLPLSQLA